MSTPLGQYLAELATDPKKYEAFLRDPDAAVRAAGLSAAEEFAVKSGDAAAIQAQLTGSQGDGRGATDSNCYMVVWTASAPGAQV